MFQQKLLYFTCLFIILLISSPIIGNTKTSFEKLSREKQIENIQYAVDEISKALPLRLSDIITWQSMFYVKGQPALEGIYLLYLVDIPYDNVDKDQISYLSDNLRTLHINSTCTNNDFRKFIFSTNVPVRISYSHTTGQPVLNFIIDKKTCLEAGYLYP